MVFMWHKKISKGREAVEDVERERRPSTSKNLKLSEMFNINIESVYDNGSTMLFPWCKFWEKRTLLEHSPYSPDLAPCDIDLLPKVKYTLKETRFQILNRQKKKWQLYLAPLKTSNIVSNNETLRRLGREVH